ncbi:hypothetical protein ASG60_20905 [Methylobacterium sp. Leaf469]|nr:hypothetical protein ASG60_20905 [Methylobacterium sp. Leaf469]
MMHTIDALRVGGFRSFNTARRTICGFEATLWLSKGFGFAGAWTVLQQNRLLGVCFEFHKVTVCDRPGQSHV